MNLWVTDTSRGDGGAQVAYWLQTRSHTRAFPASCYEHPLARHPSRIRAGHLADAVVGAYFACNLLGYTLT